jgi:cytochrome P450
MSLAAESIPDLEFVDSTAPFGGDHAYLARYVAKAPFARSPMGPIIAFKHKYAEALINDEVSRQIELESLMLRGIASGPIFTLFQNGMLTANGDVHRRRRQPVARTFAFKLMEGMRPEIRALAEELVRERKGKGRIDFLAEIASQIPARMIARILGVPQEDLPRFLGWVYDTARAIGLFPDELRPRIEASMTAFAAYVTGLLEDRRAHPREDFLTDYVRAAAEEGVLSEDELRTQVMGLILAGSDTTRISLCATLSQLLQHPEQWRAFCADPEGLKKQVVNEGLRFDPAVSGVPRILKQDLELDGYRLPAGSIVVVSFLAALRDGDVYAHPDAFDISRTDHPRWHLVFGAGPHRCLGEALARAELEETLAVIAREAPGTTLIGEPPRIEGLAGIRRVDRMEVALA